MADTKEKYQKIISTLCYIRQDGKILMLHRYKLDSHSSKRCYRGLGGKAEQGENPIGCVNREVKEEAGITVDPIWKGVVTFSNPLGRDWEAHVFVAEGYSGKLVESNEGDLCWINESDILDLDMPEGDKKFFPLLFKEGKFHAHLKYGNNQNLISSQISKL